MAKRHDHGTGLAHVEIFSAMQAAMFSGRDVERKSVFSLQHDAISSRVDPTFVRVAGDHEIVGADIAAAVKLMPARDRKSFEIDIALEPVLKDRRVGYILRLDGFEVSNLAAPGLDEVRDADFGIGAHRQSEPLDTIDLAAENLHVLTRAGNIFKEQRRRVLVALENHFNKPAHIFIPGNPRDAAQLADLFDFVQPSAQVVIG